jgi:hypothetical protein
VGRRCQPLRRDARHFKGDVVAAARPRAAPAFAEWSYDVFNLQEFGFVWANYQVTGSKGPRPAPRAGPVLTPLLACLRDAPVPQRDLGRRLWEVEPQPQLQPDRAVAGDPELAAGRAGAQL